MAFFTVRQVSRPNESGVRQVQVVDAEWDYGSEPWAVRLSWDRARSFLPNWGRVWVRPDGFGGVVIEYGQ